MKQLLFLCLSFLLLSTNVFAQNAVRLNINHELGTAPFALNTAAQNNIGHDFKLTRLEYYLSQFTIVHDGGQETNINNVYALVNATESTIIDLGNHNITSVEAVKFYVGVDSVANHSDPASYPATHALAPKLPSMHWGWASGYRFVALEGNGGTNYNQAIGLHCLGDQNYFQADVTTSATAANNVVNISIYADYTRALDNITVNMGSFEHGFDGDALAVLTNFRKSVFQEFSTSTIDFSEVNSFKVFPNPTTGQATISLEATEDLTYQVLISDVLGKTIEVINNVRNNQPIDTQINQSGLYFIQLVKNGQTVITKKLLVE